MPQTDQDQKANILLVDDRPQNLVALEAILEPLGHNLVRAMSGTEALKQLLTRDFAVILLDVQMPGMDGFETATLIKQRPKSRHIPILFVTAISKDERYVFRGYSVGAVDYIRKPFEPEILFAKVAVFVDLFRKSEQIKQQAELLRQSEQREAEQRRIEREHVLETRYLADLAASEARLSWFKATLDATLDGVLIFDARSLRFSYLNQGALNQLGYGPDEMLGMTPLDIQSQYDEPKYRTMIQPLLDKALPSLTFETQHRHRSGRAVPVEVFLQLIAPPGETERFVAIVRDIAERKESEAILAAAYEREKRIAETLQRSLLVEPPPNRFPGLGLATFYQPALEEASVGGDFFDAFAIEGERVALVSGDVSGKGLAAAARTTEIKFALRAFLREDCHPARALVRLNAFVCAGERLDERTDSSLIVLSLVVVTPQSGAVVLSSAGAEPPLLLRTAGTAEELRGGGWPLGVESGATYEARTLCIAPGDTLLLVTDGVTEARRDRSDFLGYDGMTRLAQHALPLPSLQAMGQAILDGARAFAGGPLQDDACLLLARRI